MPTFFSIILERIMYNRRYSHLTKHNLFNTTNNLDFRKIVPLIKQYYLHVVDEIYQSFDKNKYTLAMYLFIDLIKSIRHGRQILLEKLKYYGINHSYHNWQTNYLTNRKQDAHVA